MVLYSAQLRIAAHGGIHMKTVAANTFFYSFNSFSFAYFYYGKAICVCRDDLSSNADH